MKNLSAIHLRTFVIALVVGVLLSTRFGNVLTSVPAPAMPAGMPDLSTLFPPDFDFNSFMAELEKELEGMDEEDFAAEGLPYKPASQASTKHPASRPAPTKQAETATAKTDVTDEQISNDPEALILKPPLITVRNNGKDMKLPHKKADAALCRYVEETLTALQTIDRIALGINNEEFIEYYLTMLSPQVIKARVTLEAMIDKKAYRVAVLNPPKEVAQKLDGLRKEIIQARRDWMKLAKELEISEQEELADETAIQEDLASLLNEPALPTAQAIPIAQATPAAPKSPIAKAPQPAQPVNTYADDEDENMNAFMDMINNSKPGQGALPMPGLGVLP
jgi:hypothetical protein